ERLLVEYKSFLNDKSATFDVSMADVPEERSLTACIEGRAEEGWRSTGAVEQLQVGSQPAARGSFTMTVGIETTCKEVVAVRRGRRVYFFTSVFAPDDTRARDEVRKAVASVSW